MADDEDKKDEKKFPPKEGKDEDEAKKTSPLFERLEALDKSIKAVDAKMDALSKGGQAKTLTAQEHIAEAIRLGAVVKGYEVSGTPAPIGGQPSDGIAKSDPVRIAAKKMADSWGAV